MAEPTIPDVALVNNTSQRLPCVLVLDGSGSMAGEAIDQLNEGLKILESELKGDEIARQRVRLLVLRLGDNAEVQVVTDWIDAMEFSAPTIVANGNTPLGAAVRRGLSELEQEKARYDSAGISFNRPWMFIFSDGEPTDPDWEAAAAECRAAEAANKVVVFSIAVSDASTDKLAKFSDARPPAVLDGLKFQPLFQWLSRSTKVASRSAQGEAVQMPSPEGWMKVPG